MLELTVVLDNSVVFSPSVVEGDTVAVSMILSGEVFRPHVVLGEVSGQLVWLLPFVTLEVHTPDIWINPDVTFIDDSLEFYPPQIHATTFQVNWFDSLEVLAPEVASFGQVLLAPTFDFQEFYLPIVDYGWTLDVPAIPDSLVIHEPEVVLGEPSIRFAVQDFGFVFPPLIRSAVQHPLRFKFADTRTGGDISSDYLYPSQNYIPVLSSSSYSQQTDFVFSRSSDILPAYIPANEGLFSRVIYRAFYIQNDSVFRTRRNINFWVDGGSVYTIDDKVIVENKFLVDADEQDYNMVLEDKHDVYYGGAARTSVFDQLKVEYFVSPTKNVLRFNDTGVGTGINLNQVSFSPGNQKAKLPDLFPLDYIGIYLKITLQFNIDFPIDSDYFFMHLRYIGDNGIQETYPGQLKYEGEPLPILLPSVVTKAYTDTSRIKLHLDTDVENLYNKYPPYFLQLESL